MIKFFRIGKIITVHGIKGEVKIYPTTDNIHRYDDLDAFYLSKDEDADDIIDDTLYYVESVKYVKQNPIVKLKGYDKIEDSQKLIGLNLYISRENAIELKENEYYVGDIIGLPCELNGKIIGNVKDILKTKANSIIVLDYNGKDVLIPMVNEFVENISLIENKITIKTIEGLV